MAPQWITPEVARESAHSTMVECIVTSRARVAVQAHTCHLILRVFRSPDALQHCQTGDVRRRGLSVLVSSTRTGQTGMNNLPCNCLGTPVEIMAPALWF